MIEIKSLTGTVLYSCDYGSVRECAVDAVIHKASLCGADLTCADLTDADLRRADLTGADLRGAYMTRANLTGATYGKYPMTIPPLHLLGMHWDVMVLDDAIKIGCELHSTDEWERFSDDEIAQMDSRALDFWRAHKGAIMALADSRAVATDQDGINITEELNTPRGNT